MKLLGRVLRALGIFAAFVIGGTLIMVLAMIVMLALFGPGWFR